MENSIDPDIFDPVKVSYITNEPSELRDEILDRIHKLPEKVELFFYNTKTPEAIQSISNRFTLTPTQSMFLTCIIRDVAVGMTYFGDMVKEIQEKLDVPEDKARQIAQAVTELYDFALEDIKKIQVAAFPDRIKQTSQPNVIDLRTK